MEFWGVEVKSGTPLKVQPEFLKLIHISQVSLGEVKDVKGAKNIPLRLKIGDQNFIFGSLSAEDRPQMTVDLVFEKEFELSHDWKNGSVYFMGYVADPSHSDDDSADDFPFEDEDDVMENRGDGLIKTKAEDALIKPKAEDALIKPKAEDGIVSNGAANAETKKDAEMKKEDSSDSDDSDEDDSEEDDSDADMELGGAHEGDTSDSDDSGEDSLEDDSSEEELPNPKQSKKRAAEESPVATKKAKSSITPGKTGNKKVQNATPFPSKAAGKTPAGGKSKQSPKSGGQFSGKSGNKAFNSKSGKGKRGGK